MQNETMVVEVKPDLYIELALQLQKTGDRHTLNEVVSEALRDWLTARSGGRQSPRGYQWKDVYLPDGTELRLRHHGVDHYAEVRGDRLMYAGEAVSPRAWALLVTGCVHNAWRDIWIRRGARGTWIRAALWRQQAKVERWLPYTDRRLAARRCTD
ncbi:hypothetical protein MJ904_02955 [Massilia sp. MB5]|uniref:hypothetical protein n=1 Tax=Massilia sp. MB5 TaxID=2919578 RepID=UPI001F0D438A|nr:hypothetical protein [Massilia sp. MB5]UMR31222.1 hypothetical protein MJ904_02955 [Massilia sp. MB5]